MRILMFILTGVLVCALAGCGGMMVYQYLDEKHPSPKRFQGEQPVLNKHVDVLMWHQQQRASR